jgi:thiol-disulfide isomerase/thioredoxin
MRGSRPARQRAAAACLLASSLVPVLTLSACGRDGAGMVSSSSASTTDEALGLTVVPAADRSALPPVAGTTLEGAPLDVASLRGKVVVLNNWASWCAPCQDELPVLASLARTAAPGVAFVGLNVNDTEAAAKALVAKAGVPYPSIVDQKGRTLASLPGVPPAALPSTIVLDKQGRVAARVVGQVHQGELDPLLADLGREQG